MSNDTVRGRGDGLVAFFGLTFAITWGIGALYLLLPSLFAALLGPLSAASPAFVLAVAGPTIAATILAFLQGGRRGLGALYRLLAHWRFGLRWYAVMLAGVPLLGYLTSQLAGAERHHHFSGAGSLIGFLLLNLILGPLGEELGWHGFAFPRLLRRCSPLVASLILGLIWGVWHLPAFFLAGLPQASLALPLFLVKTIFMSILATWIFLHTGGSVPSTALFHYMVNITIDLFGAPQLPFALVIAVAATLVVALDGSLGWFRHGPDQGGRSPASPGRPAAL
jgi:membrane protease YdiL (CAAX protease family)